MTLTSFNGSLRDELLNEELFNTLDDARRKLALWRYDDNNVKAHSSLENQTPAEARHTLEQFDGTAHDHCQTVVCEANNERALAQNEATDYKIHTRKFSL